MQDVIESTFMVPGDGVLRGMRVQQFARNEGIRKCGGEPGRVEATMNRPAQHLYPNLELIRERGFAENKESLEEDARIERLPTSCPNLIPSIPRVEDWHNLQAAWEKDAYVAAANSTLAKSKDSMARCLTDRIGKDVDPADPAVSFLRIADDTMLETDDWETGGEQKYAAAYADCGKEYFAKLGELLLKQRPEQIERNREVLTEFAVGIVKAGYVP
ncbi:hypothetical protein [Micropruina sp.]|uniref:hypothetical protein n=1 Tax=Micropruina sp. TaxID=2737536 RepID=UPI0039E4A8D1